MANLIIKPASNGSLILQDEGGDAALTVGTTGVSTIANATITAGTFPAGHIIQTKYYSNSTQLATAATSFSTSTKIVMGTITPKYATSEILIMGTISMAANANAAYCFCDLYKNASDVTETANLSGKTAGLLQIDDACIWTSCSVHYKDPLAENSVTEKTYGYAHRANSSGGSSTIGWGSAGLNTMILMEIAV